MKGDGQRQDVAFLALAVAVLAVAMALFVGMKAIQKQKPPKPEPAQVEQEEAPKPVEEEAAKPETGRDPFKAQGGGSTASAGPASPKTELKLVGIVMEQGDRPIAIIHSSRKRYYSSVGDRAAGYTVVSIGGNEAVLEKEGERLTLVLREPEPEE